MKGIKTLEELCSRNDISDIKKWIDHAIQELKPEGLNASHALTKFIKDLVDCRSPNLPYILIVALELEPTSELIKVIHSIISTPKLGHPPLNCRFSSEVSEGNLIGWTDQTTEEIKLCADVTLSAIVEKQEKGKNIEWLNGKDEQKKEGEDSYVLEKQPIITNQEPPLAKDEQKKEGEDIYVLEKQPIIIHQEPPFLGKFIIKLVPIYFWVFTIALTIMLAFFIFPCIVIPIFFQIPPEDVFNSVAFNYLIKYYVLYFFLPVMVPFIILLFINWFLTIITGQEINLLMIILDKWR